MANLSDEFPHKWRVLVAVAMGFLLATIDGSILNIALPTLVRELDTTFPIVQWAVLAYLLTLASITLLIGRLGDMVGKKRIYTTGFVVFTASSTLVGLSPAVGFLIGFRVLQAVGAAMILSLGPAILTEAFPPRERGKALGFMGTTISVGIVAGPSLGGLLIENLSWRWIFFVNVPIGIVATVLAIRNVPATAPAGRQRFDFGGAATLSAGVGSISLALTLGQQRGFSSAPILALFGLALVALTAFAAIELRVPQPMVELRLLRNPAISVSMITGFITFVGVGIFFVMPFYLEGVLGVDTQTAGLLLAVAPIGIGAVAPISGALSDRLGVRPITLAGMLVLVIGYWWARTLDVDTTPLGFALTFLPIGIGMGIFQSPNNSAMLGAAPRHQMGLVSGLNSLTRILGQLTGIAVIGSLWASRVLVAANQEVAPQDAPPQAQVQGLRDVLGIVVALMTVGTLITLWELRREKRPSPAPVASPVAAP
jgi:EmrB/QacA subfamily drug resistance transporter